MNDAEQAMVNNPKLRGSMAAMRRAALAARKIAMQTNTEIVVVRDGKLEQITAEQLRNERID